jgi:hypothetical protein
MLKVRIGWWIRRRELRRKKLTEKSRRLQKEFMREDGLRRKRRWKFDGVRENH